MTPRLLLKDLRNWIWFLLIHFDASLRPLKGDLIPPTMVNCNDLYTGGSLVIDYFDC